MFERYTEKARRIIFFARYEASQDGSPYIEVEHLLAALLRENSAVLDPYLVRERRLELITELQALREKRRIPNVSTSVDLPLSNPSKRVLAYGAEEAEKLSHRHIGPEHVLLGMLREEAETPSLLSQFGIQIESVRRHLRESSAPTAGFSRTGGSPGQTTESAQAQDFPEGCLEIMNTGGARLAIIGLTATTVIPRGGEEVHLSIAGREQRFRVVDVKYCYRVNTPSSPYLVNHLSSVRVVVRPIADPADLALLPDAT